MDDTTGTKNWPRDSQRDYSPEEARERVIVCSVPGCDRAAAFGRLRSASGRLISGCRCQEHASQELRKNGETVTRFKGFH